MHPYTEGYENARKNNIPANPNAGLRVAHASDHRPLG